MISEFRITKLRTYKSLKWPLIMIGVEVYPALNSSDPEETDGKYFRLALRSVNVGISLTPAR